jgi:hypothetical protein
MLMLYILQKWCAAPDTSGAFDGSTDKWGGGATASALRQDFNQ